MIIAGEYSFKHGKEVIQTQYAAELEEVKQVIAAVDSTLCKTKTSLEKTMPGRTLYSPRSLNKAFRKEFEARGWNKHKVACEYPSGYYVAGFIPAHEAKGAFREIDFVKNRVGVEVQFGKYAFMVYNVCAKMTIFHNLGVIDVGIELCHLNFLLMRCQRAFHILNNLCGIWSIVGLQTLTSLFLFLG